MKLASYFATQEERNLSVSHSNGEKIVIKKRGLAAGDMQCDSII